MSGGQAISDADDGPIFVVGAPRSGTTLLRAMLNRHPRIGLCDEIFFFYWVARRERVFGDLGDPARRGRAIDRFLETRRVLRLGLDLAALREHLSREATSYPRFFLEFLRFHARALGKVRCGEKTPQHALFAAPLMDWYPGVRLIHLVRDPRDVVASLRGMPWGRSSPLGDAKLWRACLEGAEACADRPGFLRVRYETLIAQPEQELRRVCAFLGEEFTPAMVEGESGGQSDDWWFDRAQGQVETSRVGRWRQELSTDEVAIVEWVAGELLERHGYHATEPSAGARQKTRARLVAATAELRRRVRQLPAIYWRWLRPDRLAQEERAIDGPVTGRRSLGDL